jgi:hypothetical protein
VRAKSSISSREPMNMAQIMSPNADDYVTWKTSPTLGVGVRSRIMNVRLALWTPSGRRGFGNGMDRAADVFD